MNEIIESIIHIIKESDGIKAYEIAKKLKVPRKEVNKILYGRLSKLCVRDEQYLWHLRSEYVKEKANNTAVLASMEDAFSNQTFSVEDLETFLNNYEDIGKAPKN